VSKNLSYIASAHATRGTKRLLNMQSFGLGLAIFSMFFGAGNLIFPLALGQFAGDKTLSAIAGLILTAVLMPIAGVIAMVLFEGNYSQFFGRLGKIPGLLLALTVISLLGPLGSTPRCIALSYATFHAISPGLSSLAFSALSCEIIFFCAVRKNRLLALLGWGLTPLLLGLLGIIIVMGLISAPAASTSASSHLALCLHGLREGYNTMDLLAAFFFSSVILNLLRSKLGEEELQNGTHLRTAYQASVIGALLLALVYVGFSYLAAFHGQDLATHSKESLLALLITKIAGPYAGIVVSITVGLACLTTAIALISAYADFMHREILKEKVSYELILAASLLVTMWVSTFEFGGIAAFLGPVLQICYPGLIALTMLNIAHRLHGFMPIKRMVLGTFLLSTIIYTLNS